MSEQKKSLSVVTILPAENQNPGRAQLTRGTKVILSDGSELTGILSLKLVANVNGVWEATITVLPELITSITANAEVVVADVTTLVDESRRYAKVPHG